MKKQTGTSFYMLLRRNLSVALMLCCIMLFTGSNFILFSPQLNPDPVSQETQNPQGPAEEKSQESKSLTNAQEEYLHGDDHGQQHCFDALVLHKIHEAEKLPFAPTRKIYCPPRFS